MNLCVSEKHILKIINKTTKPGITAYLPPIDIPVVLPEVDPTIIKQHMRKKNNINENTTKSGSFAL